MKNIIIIIGTILLGAIIVNTLVLGDGNSLKSAATDVMEDGIVAIKDAVDFGSGSGGNPDGNEGGDGEGAGDTE